MVAIETPLARSLRSKISGGMIQESGPQVAEMEKLYIPQSVANQYTMWISQCFVSQAKDSTDMSWR